jgi:sensor histidine kinase YesM
MACPLPPMPRELEERPMRNKRKKTLRGLFLKASYISILLSVLLTSAVSFILLRINIHKYTDAVYNQELSRIRQNSNFLIVKIEAFVNDIAFNSDIQDLLIHYNEGKIAGIIDMRLAVNSYWNSYAGSLGREVSNGAIFALNGDMAGNLEGFSSADIQMSDYDWFERAVDSSGEILWLNSAIDPNNHNSHGFVIPVVKKIRAVGTRIGRDLGYLLIYLDAGIVLDYLAGESHNLTRNIFLIDAEGRVLSSRDGSMTGKRLFGETYQDGGTVQYNNRTWVYYSSPVQRPGWTIVFLADTALLTRETNSVLLVCAFTSVTLLLVFLFVSIRSAKSIVGPIRTVQDGFARLEEGRFDTSVQGNTGIIEVDDMMDHFNRMVRRLENLIFANYESKLREQTLISEVKTTEIEALQLQINPHFLYNTLDSINWMALSAGNEEISRMVLALGNFFRSNMSTTEIFTTIGKDVENVGYFLFIQKVRFDERLDYAFHIEQGLENCKTLRFLLQPLVENSIKHGIASCNRSCRIDIAVYKTGNELCIEVRDNGNGMNTATLEGIRNQWRWIEEAAPGECRVGLINIMKRLNLCYQRQARFFLESTIGTGTLVQVVLPCRRFPQ